MVSRVLSRLDRDANLHSRLRYATAVAGPRWPVLPAEAITCRAAMIPAMLWPAWTLRLLPPGPGDSGTPAEGPRTGSFGSFRRRCASFLLLPCGPPQLNFERAAPLLGNHSADTDRRAVERIIYQGRDLTPLASVLAQLAFALDENGSPIDCARRRARCASSFGDKQTPQALAHPGSRNPGTRRVVAAMRGIPQRVPRWAATPAPEPRSSEASLKGLLERFEELSRFWVCESGKTLAEAQMRACPVFARKPCPVAEPVAAPVRVCVQEKSALRGRLHACRVGRWRLFAGGAGDWRGAA